MRLDHLTQSFLFPRAEKVLLPHVSHDKCTDCERLTVPTTPFQSMQQRPTTSSQSMQQRPATSSQSMQQRPAITEV